MEKEKRENKTGLSPDESNIIFPFSLFFATLLCLWEL